MSVNAPRSQQTPRSQRRSAQQAAPATTATLRVSSRRAVFWIVIALIALLVAIIAVVINNSASSKGPALAADNPAPTGGMAVANVLKAQGVQVIEAKSAAAARRALQKNSDATLMLYDPNSYLDADHLRPLDGAAETTVLIRPGFDQLHTLAPAIAAAGAPASDSKPLTARCSVPAARKAGTISAPQSTYRLDNDDIVGCFPSSKGSYALAAMEVSSKQLYVVGSNDVFDNENVVRDGNAALALNLLGSHKTLVWYLPTIADVSASGPPSLGELTPGWLTPVILLLIVAVIAAAVWRGRRFGPLVVENLPVVVRAGETMEGRARLYQRSSARLRAMDALRIGAIGRIGSNCGLPRTATSAEVADAVAALLGANPYAIRGILLDAVPKTDADLMRLATQLDHLEHDVAAATGWATSQRPSTSHNTSTTHESDKPGE